MRDMRYGGMSCEWEKYKTHTKYLVGKPEEGDHCCEHSNGFSGPFLHQK